MSQTFGSRFYELKRQSKFATFELEILFSQHSRTRLSTNDMGRIEDDMFVPSSETISLFCHFIERPEVYDELIWLAKQSTARINHVLH